MKAKLTLVIDQNLIKDAKKMALDKKKSLSGIVENYLAFLTTEGSQTKEEISPRIQKLHGIAKVDENFDYEELLESEILKKHGY